MSTFSKEKSIECIILHKKKGKVSSTFPYITLDGELKYAIISNQRLNTMKNGGYLQPFSLVHLTLTDKEIYSQIMQIDGIHIMPNITVDFNTIAYISFVGELTSKLFKYGDKNNDLYKKLKLFILATQKKAIPMASIILGWQLLQEAGFLPANKMFNQGIDDLQNEIKKVTRVELTCDEINALRTILAYNWNIEQVVCLSSTIWKKLECLLYSFVQQQLGEELCSIEFLESMGCTIISH